MRILFLSSIYPRPYAPTRGVYCRTLCRALSTGHEVRVISPVAWVERLRHSPLMPQEATAATSEPAVDFPWYFYPPKVLRNLYGWFMWQSVRGPVRRVLRSFAPDCIVSY